MKKKLILTIDKKIIDHSKKYAASHSRSLSNLVENYLRSMTQISTSHFTVPDRVKKLRGSFKMISDFDYKKILQEEIIRKHG